MIFVNCSLKLGTRLSARKILTASKLLAFVHSIVELFTCLTMMIKFSSFKPSNLSERTEVAYILLYSSARCSVAHSSDDHIPTIYQ